MAIGGLNPLFYSHKFTIFIPKGKTVGRDGDFWRGDYGISANFCTFASVKTKFAIISVLAVLLWACSPVKHVPDGQYLLDKVDIKIETDSGGHTIAEGADLVNFLRQQPNHKVLGFAKLQLATYSLSGKDTTKWYNRWLRRLGQPPVIYDSLLTELSARQLRQAVINRGFMSTQVSVDTVLDDRSKRAHVTYTIHPGQPHVIKTLDYEIEDPAIGALIVADTTERVIGPGDVFNRNILDSERTRITHMLRNNGYYSFNNEYITFTADTVSGSKELQLTMHVQPPRQGAKEAEIPAEHVPYSVRNIYFVVSSPTNDAASVNFHFEDTDTVRYKDITVLYCNPDHFIKPDILEEKCHLEAGEPFNASKIERTYESLSQLGILKFINIDMKPLGMIDGRMWMDAYILITRNKKQSIAVELEGTNSEGDLGFGVGLTYQHRNIFHRSEQLSAKIRASYESLSGNLDGLINDNYTEVGAEVGLTFPKLEAPFLSKSFKLRSRASTEFTISTNYQERPEYTRVIAGAAWKYKWTSPSVRYRGYNVRRTFDLVDINYVYLPHSTIDFIDQIAPQNPLLRYSYEDHFIMRMGYSYYRTNRRIPTGKENSFTIQPSVSTIRLSAEMAGNLLYGFSNMVGQKKSDGAYKIFGIQYAQYVKGEADFTHVANLNSRNALAFHAGFGVGYPYGNSSMIPFEKRFYAGGANSVRGWGVRTLGPGSYESKNNVINFINQCGDIMLNLSMEYRMRLFWVFEGALFIDAGNIWTIKKYPTQPGGEFRFNKFYKQIAAGYGVGLRMDFTYFLLRLDLGMKAHDPAENAEPWPLIHPNWHRDATFHFAVGYPF